MSDALFPNGAVLVVGGSGGVGRAVCLEFAKAGTHVAVTYHKNKAAADDVAGQVKALGRKATVHQLTIGDAARCDAVVDEAAKAHGRLHTVVVGAGNNGRDGSGGARYKHAYGCYLHGSLLPKNPWFADLLLAQALARRHGPVELPSLPDSLETAAHASAVRRAQLTR